MLNKFFVLCAAFATLMIIPDVVLAQKWRQMSSRNIYKATPPNFIIILTDDQDVVLDGMAPMTQTQKHLANKGLTFTNAFTSSPICCPSRASILSGQYAHNHKTHNNSVTGGCYASHWRNNVEPTALPVLLQDEGYETFYAGKYLNQYKYSQNVPPGWDHWYGLVGNSKYYNYTLNENGIKKTYVNEYLTDMIKFRALEFLNLQPENAKPFLAILSPPAPHAPSLPASRHSKAFENVKAPRTQNFNIAPGSFEKHWLLRMPPATLPADDLDNIDYIYMRRWQTLLAVDELVDEVVEALKSLDLLDNTYIIFTSDNGYHMGQFAQGVDKRQPYDTDVRVPFIVRGPNIQPKSVLDTPIVLIDIFPTILDMANIKKPDNLDGQSFAKYLYQTNGKFSKVSYERQIVIEHWGEANSKSCSVDCQLPELDTLFGCSSDFSCHCQDAKNNTYSCFRYFSDKDDRLYCEFRDDEQFIEAYQLHDDPFQMHNLAYTMLPSEQAIYSITLEHLAQCSGESCRRIYYGLNKLAQLV